MRLKNMVYLSLVMVCALVSHAICAQCILDGAVQCKGCDFCKAAAAGISGRNLLKEIDHKQPVQNNQLNRFKYACGDSVCLRDKKPSLNSISDENRYRANQQFAHLDYVTADENKKIPDTNKRTNVLDGVYTIEQVPGRRSCQYYETLKEPDLIWEKRVYRTIWQSDAINRPFFYVAEEQTSLFEVVMNGLLKGSDTLQAYSYFRSDSLTGMFNEKLTYTEIENRLVDYGKRDISRWEIIEDWYFDRAKSVMEVKVIAIAPVIDVEMGALHLFWLYYPQLQPILLHSATDVRNNYIENYNDLFSKRYFNSRIEKETNIYCRNMLIAPQSYKK
jgi:hypothetical protein